MTEEKEKNIKTVPTKLSEVTEPLSGKIPDDIFVEMMTLDGEGKAVRELAAELNKLSAVWEQRKNGTLKRLSDYIHQIAGKPIYFEVSGTTWKERS